MRVAFFRVGRIYISFPFAQAALMSSMVRVFHLGSHVAPEEVVGHPKGHWRRSRILQGCVQRVPGLGGRIEP